MFDLYWLPVNIPDSGLTTLQSLCMLCTFDIAVSWLIKRIFCAFEIYSVSFFVGVCVFDCWLCVKCVKKFQDISEECGQFTQWNGSILAMCYLKCSIMGIKWFMVMVGCFLACLTSQQHASVCISGMDLLRQFYVLPHWDGSGRSNFLSHPVTVYWHRANQSQHWPYNARHLAG